MKKNSIFYKYLTINPHIRGNTEIMILVISGILCRVYNISEIYSSSVISITGGILIIMSVVFHAYCEKSHKQAHQDADNIDIIITEGIYSRLRHPIYLSLVMLNTGIALAFNSWISPGISIVFSAFWFFTAIIEEELLSEKFGQEYTDYLGKVRWRIIPGIF